LEFGRVRSNKASGDCIDPARKAPRGRKNGAPMRCAGEVMERYNT
jgi:hypothetical protein